MSLSSAQKGFIKRAQIEAGITDFDYRSSLATVSGMADCTSSTDPRLTDRHFDLLMGFFEAIHWRAVDAGTLQPSCKANAVFRKKGYWAAKNPRGNTSRDRYAGGDLSQKIAQVEAELAKHGYGLAYFQAIQNNLRRNGGFSPAAYLGAIKRTLASKTCKAAVPTSQGDDKNPF